MNSRNTTVVGLGVALALVISAGTAYGIMGQTVPQQGTYTGSTTGTSGYGGEMMGGQGGSVYPGGMMGGGYGGMMGGGYGGMMGRFGGYEGGYYGMTGSVSTIDNATFNKINSPPDGVTVDKTTNTIHVDVNSSTIPVEAAPTWYPKSGEYWLIYGLVNPTISVKQGATIQFLFINMDNESHMPATTTLSPPYSFMPMMDAMMGTSFSRSTWLTLGPMLPGVSNIHSTNPLYADASVSVSFSSAGTFWYVCLHPGHAQMGMYGEIKVVP